MNCDAATREMSNYIDGDLSVTLRQELEVHLHNCEHCTVILKQEDVMLAAMGGECSGELGRRWPPVGDEGYASNRSN